MFTLAAMAITFVLVALYAVRHPAIEFSDQPLRTPYPAFHSDHRRSLRPRQYRDRRAAQLVE